MAEPGPQMHFCQKPFASAIQMVLSALWFVVVAPCAISQTNQPWKDIDSSGLQIEASAGWDGIVDISTPVPFSFLIRNDSNRNLEGVFTLINFSEEKELILGEAIIAPGTTRRFTSIQSMKNWFDCVATFSHQGTILWRRQLDLTTGETFHDNVNYVLFIDEGGRRLPLPGALTNTTGNWRPQEQQLAGRDGRPVRCLTLKPWQIPNHPGPLIVTHAMVFPESTTERQLNQAQWKAVADWMSQGGHVFVHNSSQEIVNRVIESAPLAMDVATPSGLLLVRRCGLGALYEYSQPLLSNDPTELRQTLSETIAKLGRNYINTFIDSSHHYTFETDRSNRSIITVTLFFVAYTFLTGVMALFLFRLSQKWIAIYLAVVVAIFSVTAGAIGGLLQYSQGDLNWLTVTQAGVGGLVQVGAIEVQSAGGRNSRVAIKGENSDLQYIPIDAPDYYYGNARYYGNRQGGYSPFTWQPSLIPTEDGAYQIKVPMSPWGRRRCHASAFKRGVQGIDFELEFSARDPVKGDEESKDHAPKGTISLRLVNQLPFELVNCWLVVGTTQSSPPNPNSQPNRKMNRRPNGVYQEQPVAVDGLLDVYHTQPLKNLARDEACHLQFAAEFKTAQWHGEMTSLWPNGSQIPPKISRVGSASAWIIAQIRKSPILEIDINRSDFVPQTDIHLYVQEILPEDMPDSLRYSGGNVNATTAPTEVGRTAE